MTDKQSKQSNNTNYPEVDAQGKPVHTKVFHKYISEGSRNTLNFEVKDKINHTKVEIPMYVEHKNTEASVDLCCCWFLNIVAMILFIHWILMPDLIKLLVENPHNNSTNSHI
jgi:hypothetical protein